MVKEHREERNNICDYQEATMTDRKDLSSKHNMKEEEKIIRF